MENPWKVNSIDAFSYLKCPECEFDSKAESYFKRHAIKNHPLSHVFFGNDTIDDNTSITILKYNPNDIEKNIQETIKQGGKVLCGGERPKDLSDGCYFLPTIIDQMFGQHYA